MRKSKFTPHQFARILKEFDDGKSSEDIYLNPLNAGLELYQIIKV